MGQPSARKTVPKACKRVRDSPYCSESHRRTKLHNCNVYAEGLDDLARGYKVDSIPKVDRPELEDKYSVGLLRTAG